MSLRGIKIFFERIKKIKPPEIYGRINIKEEIKKQTGIDLKIEDINFLTKESKIVVKASPSEKNIIFLNKEKIIKGLEEKMGKAAPKEIIY